MDSVDPLNRAAVLPVSRLVLALATSLARIIDLSSLKLTYAPISTNIDEMSEAFPARRGRFIAKALNCPSWAGSRCPKSYKLDRSFSREEKPAKRATSFSPRRRAVGKETRKKGLQPRRGGIRMLFVGNSFPEAGCRPRRGSLGEFIGAIAPPRFRRGLHDVARRLTGLLSNPPPVFNPA